MKKIKLTSAHAIVKHLIAQKILIDGKKEPLFAGAFGIFGHGNVACLGQALEENKDSLPTFRGHHEQNMALTGIAYARAKRRKQIFIATSSVGPGSTNMVTAAAVAMSNRLPILFLPGDTYANRIPDPVKMLEFGCQGRFPLPDVKDEISTGSPPKKKAKSIT